MSQRITRRRMLQAALATAAVGATGYPLLIEPSEFHIDRVKVDTGLPTGLRIGALSDFHLADTISQTRVETATRLLARQNPDLIVLLGDYSTAMYATLSIHGHVETALGILSKLRAPLGVYAILGNHDVTAGLGDIKQMIRAHRITPLINEGVVISTHGERFGLAGLADALQQKPDRVSAVRAITSGIPFLGLVHEPDASSLLSGAALVLSGHSHGGQVRLPVVGAPVLPRMGRRFPWGLRRNGDTLVYTSRGVGMVPPRVRFNCPPEVTVIDVVSAGGVKPMGPVG